MAVVAPKTIFITALPSKSATFNTSWGLGGGATDPAESLLESGQIGPRKRRRLTHLSPEERMLRRKLKNRVAAQTARDRKKVRMTDLEEALAELEEQNKRLEKENNSLRHRTKGLVKENEKLKERLCLDNVVIKKEKSESRESAAGTGSDSSSVDHTLHCISSDSESDMFLGLLQQISEAAVAVISTDDKAGKRSQPHSEVVGPTPAELESLNELIKFDHIYYKSEEEKVNVEECKNNDLKGSLLSLPESTSSLHNVPADVEKPLTNDGPVPMQQDDPIPDFDSAVLNITDMMDLGDRLGQLVDLDSFLQENMGSAVPSNICASPIKEDCTDSSEDCFVVLEKPAPKLTKMDTEPTKQQASIEAPPSTLFLTDDIFDLAQTTSSLSDSGYGSDMSEAASPRSDVSSMLGDDLWGESFSELFPSLV